MDGATITRAVGGFANESPKAPSHSKNSRRQRRCAGPDGTTVKVVATNEDGRRLSVKAPAPTGAEARSVPKNNGVSWLYHEQALCSAWMATYGYPLPVTGPRRSPQQLAGLWAADLIMEEVLEILEGKS